MSFFHQNNPTSTFLFGVTAGISVATILSFVQSYFFPANRRLDASDINALSKLEKEFNISSEMLQKIARQMVSEMKRGLAADGQTLKMIPSFVTKRPSGSESGTYLALDLGGSNFRVCEVTLLGGSSPRGGQQLVRVRQKKFTVSEELKKGDGTKLFDFFAECIKLFVEEIQSEDAKMDVQKGQDQRKLGFTFSFPVQQVALDKGKLQSEVVVGLIPLGSLMQWTKGFTCMGVEGQDVVKLLQEALARKVIVSSLFYLRLITSD